FTWLESIEDECSPAGPGSLDFVVRLRPDDTGDGNQRGRRTTDAPLGSVRFVNTTAHQNVFLAVDEVKRMVLDSPLGDVPVAGWSLPVRDRMIGRAYGRVLAHEIGHLLLAMPTHDTTGLMRTSFSARDLVSPGREHLTIGRNLIIRLQERLAMLRGGRNGPTTP